MSIIGFPRSYETVYEIYYTMLIERLRLRQTPVYPSSAAMGQLFFSIQSRRKVAVLDPIDGNSDMLSLLPDSSDMLKLKSAARIASYPNVNTTIRYTQRKIVYEYSSRRYRYVDHNLCGANLSPSTQYFPFVESAAVQNIYEACCATECNFLHFYGHLFSESRSNCCRGCNRFWCSSNTRENSHHLANALGIVTPGKEAYVPRMMSMII